MKITILDLIDIDKLDDVKLTDVCWGLYAQKNISDIVVVGGKIYYYDPHNGKSDFMTAHTFSLIDAVKEKLQKKK